MEIKICNGILCYNWVSFKPILLSALSVPSHTESETREELYCVDNPVKKVHVLHKFLEHIPTLSYGV